MAKPLPTSSQVERPLYCFLESHAAKSHGLRVTAVGMERCRPDYKVERSRFVGHTVEFVAAGLGAVELDGKSWPLGPGSLFCYGPRTPHVITTHREHVMTKFFVNFVGDEARQALVHSALAPGVVLHTPDVESLRGIFETLLYEGSRGLPGSAAICACYLKILLLKANESVTSGEKGTRDVVALNFQRCRALIDSHFLELRGLDDIAVRLHISTAYLCRLFQKFGYPGPCEYLVRKKLSYAAGLLAKTGCAVKVAAAEVGYPDPYHFSRAFRRHFGLSPREFAQQYRE
jgi:AraC-like DNA-binding protein